MYLLLSYQCTQQTFLSTPDEPEAAPKNAGPAVKQNLIAKLSKLGEAELGDLLEQLKRKKREATKSKSIISETVGSSDRPPKPSEILNQSLPRPTPIAMGSKSVGPTSSASAHTADEVTKDNVWAQPKTYKTVSVSYI